MKPGLYDLVRDTDQSGVSGTGRVAQVAVFEDGSACTRWLTGKDSSVMWAKVEDMVHVHIDAHLDTTHLVPVALAAPLQEEDLGRLLMKLVLEGRLESYVLRAVKRPLVGTEDPNATGPSALDGFRTVPAPGGG